MSETARFLAQLRRRRVADAVARAAASIGLATALAVVGLVALAPVLASWPAARALVAAGALGLVAAVAYTGAIAPLRRAASERAAAREAEARRPALRGALVGALELEAEARTEAARHYSPRLAQAAVERTDRLVAGVEAGTFADPAGRRRAEVFVAFASLALVAALATIAPSPLAAALGAFFGPGVFGGRGAGADAAGEATLGVGDLTLTYRFPDYTGLESRRIAHSTGAVRALVGTEVTVEATADRSGDRAALELDDGRRREAAVTAGREVAGSLTVSGADGYRIVLGSPGGREWRSKRFAVVADPDAAPEVALLYPGEDLAVQPLDAVRIEFDVEDDFGLGEAELVVEREGRAEARPIGRAPEGGRRWTGEYLLEVGSLGIEPGESVQVFVRAADNDVVSGPKWGESARRAIRIVSRTEEQTQLIELEQALLDELVVLLADYLEFRPREPRDGVELLVFGERTLEKLGTASASVSALLALFARDEPEGAAGEEEDAPAAVRVLGSVAGHLDEISTALEALVRGAAPLDDWRAHGGRTGTLLERDVLALDRLIYDQSLDNLVGLSESMLDRQRDMESLLQRMAEGLEAPEALAALERQVREIEQALAEIAQQVERMASGLPDEFLNSDAMESIESDRVGELLRELREALAAGDAERAAALAQELMEALTQMTAALDEAYATSTGGAEGSDVLAKVEDHLARIDDLAREQERLKGETEAIDAARREQAAEAQARRQRERVERLKALIETLERDVDHAGRTLRSAAMLYTRLARNWQELDGAVPPLRLQVEEDAIDLARDQARLVQGLAKAFEIDVRRHENAWPSPRDWPSSLNEDARAAEKSAAEIVALLEEMMASEEPSTGAADRGKMDQAAADQGELGRRTSEARESLEELAEAAPLLAQGARGAMEDAGGAMGEAADRLAEGASEKALDAQREALYRLSQARGELESAREELSRARPGRGGLSLFPRTMARAAGRSRSHERVEIPDADRSRAPRRFREDLLDAMKEKPPERYEELVRDYYRSLTQ